jgi:hypothetical protein
MYQNLNLWNCEKYVPHKSASDNPVSNYCTFTTIKGFFSHTNVPHKLARCTGLKMTHDVHTVISIVIHPPVLTKELGAFLEEQICHLIAPTRTEE